MLNEFWNWFVTIVSIASILACWWLLHWTKGISDRDESDDASEVGHVWDHDIRELNHPLPRWWLHLFNITIIFAFIYLAIFPGLGNWPGTLGWTQLGKYEAEMQAAETAQAVVYARFADMDSAALASDEEAMDIGRRLFGNNCAMCHGSDGRGGLGFPNLTDDAWQWGEGYNNILAAITDGRQGAMPALGAALSDEQVHAIAHYVRSVSGLQHDSALANAGQQDFNVMCVACHGPDAKGNPALGAPDLSDAVWLYGSDVENIMETVKSGRNGKMPSHKDILREEQRRILAAYVENFSAAGE